MPLSSNSLLFRPTLVLGCLLLAGAHLQDETGLRLVEGRIFVVSGLLAGDLASLARNPPDSARWRQVFRVWPVFAAAADGEAIPPMLGRYEIDEDGVRFIPRFPLEPGLGYRARFDGPALVPGWPLLHLEVTLPPAPVAPTTRVTGIYPSAEQVPENLLKFYITFSQSMRRGHAYQNAQLLDEDGRPLTRALLTLDEELWDPARRRLTLFLDPGRIKRGLRPHAELGAPLREAGRIRLVVDAAMPDENGVPLRQGAEKEYRVGPADRSQPDPGQWHIAPPAVGSRDPFVITFPEPLDAALLRDALVVTTTEGHVLEGQIEIDDGERRWQFVPQVPWHAIAYRLEISTILEDLAGNNLRKKFDRDAAASETEAVPSAAIIVRTFTPAPKPVD